jgi:hypothetical protein
MATRAVIHNGCTTGVEAYMMGVPAISYRAEVNDDYDLDFYRLPNLISHQSFNADDLVETLNRIVSGELGAANGNDRKALVDQYLAAQNGSLACERIVDVVEDMLATDPNLPKPPVGERLMGQGLSLKRRASRLLRSKLPGSHAPPEFHKHRYPGATAQELNRRILRFQQLLGDDSRITAQQVSDQIFKVSLNSE